MVDHVRTSSSMTWNSQQWSQLRLLLRRNQPAGHRLLVLATSSSLTVSEFPQIAEMFNLVVEVPALREAEHFSAVLRETATFASARKQAAAVLEVDAEAPLGIKTLLAAIDMAQDVVASVEEGSERDDDEDAVGAGEGMAAADVNAKEEEKEAAEGDDARTGLLLTPAALRDQLRLTPHGLRKQTRKSPEDDPNNPTRGSVVGAAPVQVELISLTHSSKPPVFFNPCA